MKLLTPFIIATLMAASVTTAVAAEDEAEVLYWQAPMDPNYKRDKPGTSPMGMELIPVYANAGGDDGSDVIISPAVVQNLGVRTAPVGHGDLSRVIDTVGYVDFDESLVSHIHLRVSGWIERLSVQSEGERVKKGQRLFNLYSPDLVNAQEEFVRALTSKKESLIRASRERLKALRVSKDQIRQLEKSRKVKQTIAIYAPQDGVVSTLAVREGMYIKPSMKVMTLADLSSVWLMAEIFERQSDWVKEGDEAIVQLPFLPGRTWKGQVEYIYPSLNSSTRTLMARLRFDNPGESLKPGMFAEVKLLSAPKTHTLYIPLEALIRSGSEDRVIIALGGGKFDARVVTTGIESDDKIEILKGLVADENVVISGQFLLDSEASLRASFTRMSDTDTAEPAMDNMAGMDMSISGTGSIITINKDNHSIRLQHDPIPALDWPAMEMDFVLGTSVSGEKFSPGDMVQFSLEKRDDAYTVIHLQPQH